MILLKIINNIVFKMNMGIVNLNWIYKNINWITKFLGYNN